MCLVCKYAHVIAYARMLSGCLVKPHEAVMPVMLRMTHGKCEVVLRDVKLSRAACSSSLMAFNDAITDLGTGRIDYAVVGGASGIFRPQTSIAFQRLHMMSPDVRSHHHSAFILVLDSTGSF